MQMEEECSELHFILTEKALVKLPKNTLYLQVVDGTKSFDLLKKGKQTSPLNQVVHLLLTL